MTRRRWTPDEDAVLRARYADTRTDALARELGHPLQSTYRRARALGLKKSAAYLASPAACRLRREDAAGIVHRFPKGHVPANKGLRRPGWHRGRMQETQFRKGERNGVAATLYKRFPKEIAQAVQLLGALNNKINRRVRP